MGNAGMIKNFKNLKKKKCFLLDMDGTIYLGNNLIEGADKFWKFFVKREKDIFFLQTTLQKIKRSM